MILADVNLLVDAHREDAENHAACRAWLEGVVNADRAYGMSGLALSGFMRVVTHPRVFREPSPIAAALAFADQLLGLPQCVPVRPGPRHWPIVTRLCRESGVKRNLVPDALLAALTTKAGRGWITIDRDFARFKGLRGRHPLSASAPGSAGISASQRPSSSPSTLMRGTVPLSPASGSAPAGVGTPAVR